MSVHVNVRVIQPFDESQASCHTGYVARIDRRGFIGRGSADLVMNLLFDREHHGTDGPDDRRILSLGAVLNGRNVSQRSVRIEHMEAGS